ncbi:MAG: DNA/RNA non-specific endonuclease [Bacteroidia bacterium]|nr:DNA/RNA non-specific endonuclease [Bacteroidia bacterium]NNF32173.1 DNA/RNA non-specific endonuclease [Flavobacteriaceae bacterium]MBT8276636.1 DNA/RNA non-specific endonuclease [Bacteroidia bacterium]NNJ82894.1 DNA/RNA non-specific endonuclease [Flavobacteriaceae bacterium]NNK55094.1 DNA/RNA non-specific endonuclease [Flavobacteriaceae bacterium]
MNRKYLYPLLIILITVALYFAEKYIDRQNEDYPIPVVDSSDEAEFDDRFLPNSTTGKIVRHAYFNLSYSEKHEQAEWIAYELKQDHLAKTDFERPYFVQDRKIRTGSADWRNYKNSGYDRGHLCPAGDRRFNYDAYHETFLTSNISPQDHEFNAGIWNRLEQKVRYWARGKEGVFVITGGVLKNGLKTIGDEEVSVPEEFFKIVVDRNGEEYKAIAFLIPNKESSLSFYEYAVTIDEIEKKTGIDFLRGLDDKKEDALERELDRNGW